MSENLKKFPEAKITEIVQAGSYFMVRWNINFSL
jgi:hypothetical protein